MKRLFFALMLFFGAAHFAQVVVAAPKVQNATISVTPKGFAPSAVNLKAGVPARLTFVRKTNATCATSVTIPSLKIKKTLPLNKPVTVQFTPKKTRTLVFSCGMKMIRGKLVVK